MHFFFQIHNQKDQTLLLHVEGRWSWQEEQNAAKCLVGYQIG
jgi:hypothetical protein